MDKLKSTLLVSMTVLASGSGLIQVSAADYIFDVNFDDKIVDNFDDYTQTFLNTTDDLDNVITFNVQMTYYMDNCSSTVDTNMALQFLYRPNGVGTVLSMGQTNLPELVCRTTPGPYFIEASASLPLEHLVYIINDDADFLQFRPTLNFIGNVATTGRVINITNLNILYSVNYDFNTTYLFNYFLSDTDYSAISLGGPGWSGTPTVYNYFDYVMTTAGNDNYYLLNTSTTDYGSIRNKWAVDYNEDYFRGEMVGARHKTQLSNGYVLTQSNTTSFITLVYNYYYLNVSNKEQDITNVPEFEFEYEDCGSFLALNVPCFINNGLAYVVNDAPVISDAFTLLNAGMKLGGQAFSIIGQFSDNNLFGVLVLGGLGITAVRWFLKQD
jgi:hypothetical protein